MIKEMLRLGGVLAFICVIAGGVLAAVHGVTAPAIAAQKEGGLSQAFKEVLPQGATFEPRPREGKTAYYVAYDAHKQLCGFVCQAEAKGYSSTIETLVGLTPGLEITAIKILSQNETPGLGSRVAEDGFTRQFVRKKLADFDAVQAITGATISSSAVIRAVKQTIARLEPLLRQEH